MSESSSEDEAKKLSDEDRTWSHRVSSKRVKGSEDKKKNSSKSKTRRKRSRVSNVAADYDSGSESDYGQANRKLQPAARVPSRPRVPPIRPASNIDNSDSDENGHVPEKLQEEESGNVQDKKKSDTLRKLFSSSKGKFCLLLFT